MRAPAHLPFKRLLRLTAPATCAAHVEFAPGDEAALSPARALKYKSELKKCKLNSARDFLAKFVRVSEPRCQTRTSRAHGLPTLLLLHPPARPVLVRLRSLFPTRVHFDCHCPSRAMPTCRRKRVLLTEPSSSLLADLKSNPDKEVFYLAQTGEIFPDYA